MAVFQIDNDTLYLIYDGECPLCNKTAHALNIKQAVNQFVLINARESHPLIQIAFEKGFHPEQGIIVLYRQQYYYAEDALHFLALMNSPSGYLNKITGYFMKWKGFTRFLYPILKFIRLVLLNIKGVHAIQHFNHHPLFYYVLGEDWHQLPPVMKRRFSNKNYSHDKLIVEGFMTIRSSWWMRAMKPLLKLSGALVHQEGERIPVTVTFRSDKTSARYWFERYFNFTPPVQFTSYMMPIKENIIVEFMRFGMGWRSKCFVKEDAVVMQHAGYVWRFFKILIPLPIHWLLGECHVVEKPVTSDTFSMDMRLTHFLFGTIYEYKGIFKLMSEHHE